MPGPRIPSGVINLQHLHPKVTARALGGNTCVVTPSAPSSPNKGDLWINPANSNQVSQWSGSQWNEVSLNAGSLTGENFQISAPGQFHYASPPAFTTWSFESGMQGWTATNATASPSPAWSQAGGYSALLTYTSGTSWALASPPQAVQAGNQVFVSAWVNAPQALGAVGMQLAWYNSGSSLISTSSAATAPLAANTPAQLTYNAAPPAGAVSCEIIVQDNETSVTGYQLYVDDIYIAGQLAVAIAPSAGSDNLANPHPVGMYTAGPLGTGVTMSTGSALEAQAGNTGVTASGSGSTLQLGTGLWGPKMAGGTAYEDFASVNLLSSQHGASGTAIGVLYYTAGGGAETAVLSWGADGVSVFADGLTVNGGLTSNEPITAVGGITSPNSALNGTITVSQVDYLYTNQANPTSWSRLCKVWDIPVGDPITGTAYRLSTFGTGVWEGNPLSFQITAFGESIAPLPVGGTFMSAGTGFYFDLVATLVISETGATGLLSGSIRLNMAQSGSTQLPNTGANAAGGFVSAAQVGAVSGIGTVDSGMTVQVQFASSASGQSTVSMGSTFERIGGPI